MISPQEHSQVGRLGISAWANSNVAAPDIFGFGIPGRPWPKPVCVVSVWGEGMLQSGGQEPIQNHSSIGDCEENVRDRVKQIAPRR